MPVSVGNFGGFKGRAVDTVPDRRGTLGSAVRLLDSDVELLWPAGESGEKTLLRLDFPADGSLPSRPTVRGWIALDHQGLGYRALLSRASPAVRLRGASDVTLRGPARALGVVDGQLREVTLAEAPELAEPWVVLFDDAAEVCPVLVTFTRRVRSSEPQGPDHVLRFGGPFALHVMPLEGIRRRARGDTPFDHWAACARAWVGPLLAFPVACREEPLLDGGLLRVLATFEHERLTDAWGNQPVALAPLPPALAEVAARGFAVGLPPNLVTASLQLNLPTLFGPFQFVEGPELEYTLPLPPGLDEAPAPSRPRDPWTRPIRDELAAIVAGIGDPSPDYVDNNLRVATFLADALPELTAEEAQRASIYAEKALEGALSSLHHVSEPLTGQPWSTLDNTWRAKFSDDASPWAKDNERFDSEFYNGQALSSLLAARALVPSAVERYYPQAADLYRYFAIFFDWATGSVLTHATGDSANIDGMLFAWEGMIAMARMAALQGDPRRRLDAVYRASRQMASIYGLWCHQSYAADHDYCVGHVSHGRLPPTEVDRRFPIDAWVNDQGAAVSEPRSFWQCTNFLFYANRPLYQLYRDHGLLPRLREIMLDVMPSFHPRWADGEATDPHGENGQERYGTSWTAAQLHGRAALLGCDPLELLALYQATKLTPAEQTWYRMTLPQIAGPLMLALLEAPKPAAPAA